MMLVGAASKVLPLQKLLVAVKWQIVISQTYLGHNSCAKNLAEQ